tara:strand:- start:650 stop:1393 length:744 start_codon:yes stop_codon:yes gene_type:complete
MSKIFENWNKYLDSANDKSNVGNTWQIITEATLNRVMTKYADLGFIVISADRSCSAEKGSPCSDEEEAEQDNINKQNEKNIKADIRAAGFGFIPSYGGFREKDATGEGSIEILGEKSFIIPVGGYGGEKVGIEGLKQLGIELSKKYNQDSFFFKPPDEEDKDAYWINQSGGVDGKFTGVVTNDPEQQFFTRLRKDKGKQTYGDTFTYTEGLERVLLIPPTPDGMSEARQRYGEIFHRIDETRCPRRR